MRRGKIKWFSSKEGYGFIEPHEGDEDVFVHHSEVPDEELQEGEEVEFETEQTPKGISAVNVHRTQEVL